MLVDEQLLNRGKQLILYEQMEMLWFTIMRHLRIFSIHRACLCWITILTIKSPNIPIFLIAFVQKCHEYGFLVVDQACSLNYPVIQYCTQFWQSYF